MHIYSLRAKQTLPIDLETAWDFFSNPANLQQITPDDLDFRIDTPVPDRIHAGLMIGYRLRVPPGVPVRWWTQITSAAPPHRFVDEQISGPYRLWIHEHRFTPTDDGVEVEDIVHYALPFGPLGRLVHWLYVGRQVRGIFEHRRRILEDRFRVDATNAA